MSKSGLQKKDLYYTNDHEWIDFQGTVAYAGVCKFKLTGFKQIKKIKFSASGFKKKGEVIASVESNDYHIEVHMPVDGKVLQVNDKLISGNPNILLDCAESSAWIALIIPTLPHERKDLMISKKYQMTGNKKNAK